MVLANPKHLTSYKHLQCINNPTATMQHLWEKGGD